MAALGEETPPEPVTTVAGRNLNGMKLRSMLVFVKP